MKQKLCSGLIFNLLLLSLSNINSPTFAAQQPNQTESPATTVKQWRTRGERSLSQSNNSLTHIIEVRTRETPQGIEIRVVTRDNKVLQGIQSTEGNNLIIDFPNARLNPQIVEDIPESSQGISALKVTTAEARNTVRIVISGKEGTPTGKVITSDRGATISVISATSAAADIQTQPDQVIDIIVTAQKQPEKLQEVPISLTTLPKKEIEDAKIDTFRDVAANTPNFYTTVGDRAFNFQSIRGLGNSNFLSRDSISFFIDDVPYENVHQFLPGTLFDVERIEVLRGPQSTLYGRNSQAGVVNVISRKPRNSPEITLGASYGNFNQRQLEFSASDAVIDDKLGFRIAGAYDARDGFTENTFLDDDANNLSSIGGRANIVWTPTKQWNISFNATGGVNNDGDNTFVPIDSEEPFETELDIDGDTDLSINTQSLRVGYEGKGFNLTSISARNDTNLNYNADGDYSPEDLFEFDTRQETTIFSQEIRLQSPESADRLRWIVGGYFQDRNYDIDPQQLKFSPAGGLAFFGAESAGNSVTQGIYDQTTLAGFGQVDFKPIDPLTLTAGLRYENSEESLSRRAFVLFEGDNSGENTPFVDSDVNDSAVIPKFALEYSFSPNIATYGSITRGYKPPTQNYSTDDPALRDVDAEKSWNYELGVKSSWLKNRLSLNVAGFINDVSDYQVALAGDSGFFEDVTNAEVLIKGFEIEAKAKPIEGFDLIAGFGYTDAEYSEYINPLGGEDFEGNRLIYVPEFTYNLAAQYRTKFGLFSRLELQGLGNYFFDDDNTIKQDSLALVNARIGYEADKYGIYLFANNIFDEEYLTAAFGSATAGGTLASFGDRRTFGIQVKSEF